MKFTRKTVWKIAAIGGALFCVVAVAFLVILQSNWFRNEVRKRIVAQVETATGGKVEIAGFDYRSRGAARVPYFNPVTTAWTQRRRT